MHIESTLDELDEIDRSIYAKRLEQYKKRETVCVGDYFRFSNQELRRVALTQPYTDKNRYQCSAGGSFYFFGSSMSFSGSFASVFEAPKLILTEEVAEGRVWFFHHHKIQAHNGITFMMPCKIWECPIIPDWLNFQ